MSSKNNKVVKRNNVERKEYSYQLGNITLKATLRSDVKEEMKNFLKLMEAAAVDINKQLDKLK